MTTIEQPEAPGSKAPRHGRFGLFLAVLTIGFVISGFGQRWASAVGITMSALLAVIAFRNARMIKDARWVAALCASAVVATVSFVLINPTSEWRALPMILQAATLAVLVALTVAAALNRSQVDLQTILAAISAYVLIGLVYAWAYLAIDVIDDDQFSMAATDATTYFSFSFIVQTTVGFGDQIPTASFASRIVVTQAVIGQVFLVTLVARLVSMFGATRSGSPDVQDRP